MSFWSAVVLIFLIASITYLRAAKYRNGRDRTHDIAAPHDGDLEREVQRLRERIAVLERIATDERKTQDIAKQIESLRD